MVSELDLRRLLQVVSQLLREKIPHHFASIGLWEEEEQRLRRHALVSAADAQPARGRAARRASAHPPTSTFRRGETTVFNWDDVQKLGEPSVSAMAVEGLRSVCCVPLKTARGAYGVLNLGKPDDDSFRPDEVELLEEVGQQLAIAFENALSFRAAERYRQEALVQRDRLRLLLDINNELLAQHESHATRLSVLARARRFVSHDYAALVIFDAEANELRIEAHTYNDDRGVIEPRLALPLGRSPSGVAFFEQRTRMFTSAEFEQFDPGVVAGLIDDGIRSMCCVPLITQRGPLGTLTVGRRSPDGFTAAEVSLLGDVAGQVAIAVANTLAYQEISALKDRLTEEKLYLEDEISSQHDFTQIIGTSQALTSVLRQIRTVGPTDATVLLLGETGTGKELLARALHDASRRRAQTFVRVNGAALPAGADRERALRLREGRVHRRHRRQGGPLRAGAPRHAVPRRGRRNPARRAAEAAAGAAGAGVRAPRQHADAEGGRAAHRRHQPRSQPAWWPAARSAATSTTASACSPSSCRRCASARRTSRRSCTTSCASSRARSAAASTPFRPRRWTRSRSGRGRATSASWRT